MTGNFVNGVLRQAKKRLLSTAVQSGLAGVVADSAWRGRRFLILCYHGVALADEDRWHPALYMSPGLFERRLHVIADQGYRVLSLTDAVERLHSATLPIRAVVITFDDGAYDFYAMAWPLLRRYGYPATVYLTSYYADHDYPVFNLFGSYASWRAGVPWQPPDTSGWTGHELNQWLRRWCDRIGVDYRALANQRILHLMRPPEVTELARQGGDVQLHTHRHRLPLDAERFAGEIRENRQRILEWTGRTPSHFCYPSGRFRERFRPWLVAEGVRTATTCEPGLVGPRHDLLLLPRLVDHQGLSEAEFVAWLSGAAALVPRRRVWQDPDRS